MDAELKECLDVIRKDVVENKVSLANITKSNVSIQNDILQIRGHIIEKFVAENRDSRSRVRTLETRVLALEKTSNRVEQNNRKNNIEFEGIPSSVNDQNLKETVVNIINDVTKDGITCADIEACHRLPSKRNPQPTIIRANRNLLDRIRKNKKSLMGIAERLNFPAGTNIYLNNNLSSAMKCIDYNARLLVKKNLAQSSWYSNAFVKVKALNGKVLSFNHEMDLYEAFPDFEGFSFDTSFYENLLSNDMDELDDLAGIEFGSSDMS